MLFLLVYFSCIERMWERKKCLVFIVLPQKAYSILASYGLYRSPEVRHVQLQRKSFREFYSIRIVATQSLFRGIKRNSEIRLVRALVCSVFLGTSMVVIRGALKLVKAEKQGFQGFGGDCFIYCHEYE